MRQVILFALLLAMNSAMWASQSIAVSSTGTGLNLTNNTGMGFDIHYSVGELQSQEIITKSGVFNELTINDYTSTNQVGYPKLPLLRKIISVPVGAQVNVVITNTNEKTYSLEDYQIHYPIMPYQPSLSKNQEPGNVPFEYNTLSYYTDSYSSIPLVQVTELGYMRGVRLFALDFVPVRYNPVSRMIKVVSEVDMRVNFDGANMAATTELLARTASFAFESVYRKSVLNYSRDTRSTLNRYPLGYLILTPASFRTTLQPFIDMKVRQGYNVTVSIVGTGAGTIGSTTTAIKTYLQGVWDSATATNPAPSFCLLVGDTPQIPAWTSTTDMGHVSDLSYFRLHGNDYIPEMYYGRFSATTIAELQPQIDKSLQYEQFSMPDPSYLQQVVMIAGVDTNFGPSNANGQINYGTQNYFNSQHGITSHTYLYPSSGSNSNEALIQTNLSSGIGFANYTAHGDVDQWYDPYMTISNINVLTNANKYFVAIGNCCLTNHFDTPLCFGEAMLRASNKGAVAYIGGNNSTLWDEDYWWAVGNKPVVGGGTPWAANQAGAYDLLFHEHEEAFEDWIYSMGSIVFSGNLAVSRANSPNINLYWEIYSIMGDPALQPYMGLPNANTATLPSTINMGIGTVQISAEPYSYVAISKNNVLHGAGLVDQSGVINLTFVPFTETGNAQIVITRSNRRPLIQDVQVLPLAGPYLSVTNFVISDGDNHQAEAGETFNVNLFVNNAGYQDAQNVTAVLSTSDPYVILNTSTTSALNIGANSTVTINAAYHITVLNNAPDQHSVPLTITMTDANSGHWIAQENIVINAPNILIGSPIITEITGNGNNSYDPGETVQFSIPISNTGHANSSSIHAVIVSNNHLLSISEGITDISSGLNVDQNTTLNCHIVISPDVAIGILLPIGISIQGENCNTITSSMIQIGNIGDGFETGNVSAFPWVMSGASNWMVVSGNFVPHTGTYCLKSGQVTSFQTTSVEVNLNVSMAGNVSFWKRVSSEEGYDKLLFYIDGIELDSWSGELAWTQSSYSITQGSHLLKWSYSKDISNQGGSDCAWIDDISFPASGITNAPMFFTGSSNIEFGNVADSTTVTKSFLIQNLGTQTLTGTVTYPDYYTLMIGDQVVNNFSIEPGTSQTCRLTLYRETLGILNDQLVITTNDPYLQVFNISLTGTIVPVGNHDNTVVPLQTELNGNYPNPFNPSTYIAFSLRQTENVTVVIYNVKGQLVKTLVKSRLLAGNHRILWDGKDDLNHAVATGMYLYHFQAGNVNSTKKMMLVK